ncbi:MAG: hypothetical protein AAF399_29135 [Bacteroidota bacterium]
MPNILLNGFPDWISGNVTNWQIKIWEGNQTIGQSGEVNSLIEYDDKNYPISIEHLEITATGNLSLNEQRVEISYH